MWKLPVPSPASNDDARRDGRGAAHGAEERAAAPPPRPAAAPSVPPMEAEWLRAVGAPPAASNGNGAHGVSNGAGSNGAGSKGAGPNGAGAGPAAGNGPLRRRR
jgi:hypothetical protein